MLQSSYTPLTQEQLTAYFAELSDRAHKETDKSIQVILLPEARSLCLHLVSNSESTVSIQASGYALYINCSQALAYYRTLASDQVVTGHIKTLCTLLHACDLLITQEPIYQEDGVIVRYSGLTDRYSVASVQDECIIGYLYIDRSDVRYRVYNAYRSDESFIDTVSPCSLQQGAIIVAERYRKRQDQEKYLIDALYSMLHTDYEVSTSLDFNDMDLANLIITVEYNGSVIMRFSSGYGGNFTDTIHDLNTWIETERSN